MQPVWMNTYHCVFDRSFEQYVEELPLPEALEEQLNQRNQLFCWLYTPIVEDVVVKTMDGVTKMELVGACYAKENGSPVQSARFYRYTQTGEKDFVMVTEDGRTSDGLGFEEMITAGSNLDTIQEDLR